MKFAPDPDRALAEYAPWIHARKRWIKASMKWSLPMTAHELTSRLDMDPTTRQVPRR